MGFLSLLQSKMRKRLGNLTSVLRSSPSSHQNRGLCLSQSLPSSFLSVLVFRCFCVPSHPPSVFGLRDALPIFLSLPCSASLNPSPSISALCFSLPRFTLGSLSRSPLCFYSLRLSSHCPGHSLVAADHATNLPCRRGGRRRRTWGRNGLGLLKWKDTWGSKWVRAWFVELRWFWAEANWAGSRWKNDFCFWKIL